ncbi:hypothetical protein SAMN02745174_01282 [Cetobacterium ceti]|uniref:AB hydrolase-1 domain-containing protein n=1 Tax=Cetobacterium ceti TaxID=180163 RepID=A0A1T4MRH4_9FUSO|nr:alpha/beta fold hydrolase [Cetobacterium ceti]SJZ69318.1 hypothetical protein SAMN02745174_01282 [Cetobacterium ceti]
MKNYIPAFLFKNKHINTCYPTLFRKVHVDYSRERIVTPDNDFLDIDWVKNNNNKLLILCHGLEGSSESPYMKGMAKYYSALGWDILAMNYRGCSGELNKQPIFYNCGFTKDLEYLIEINSHYDKIALSGFSLGANIILKYLGERKKYPKNLLCAAVVSPPMDMEACSKRIKSFSNALYKTKFLKTLKEKVIEKNKLYPGIYRDAVNLKRFSMVSELDEFDDIFTAPIHGYLDAHEYYEKNSSLFLLDNIKIPTYILTPLDDPIMANSCYPYEKCNKNEFLTFETPEYGGHVGFSKLNDDAYWHEEKISEFFEVCESGEKSLLKDFSQLNSSPKIDFALRP